MTAVSKNVYMCMEYIIFHDIVNKYNNTYHRTTTIHIIEQLQ